MSRYHCKEFDKILFMGACQPGSTEAQILTLKKILDDCLTEVGGLQQPAHSLSEEMAVQVEQEYQAGWIKVKDMVKDIAMALTGDEIKFPEDIEQDAIDDEFDRALNDEDEDVEEDVRTIVLKALDKHMLDEDCGAWWLARAKRIVRDS